MILLICCCCCCSHFFHLACKGWISVMGFVIWLLWCACVGASAGDLCVCGTWQCVYWCVRTVVSVFMWEKRLLCACLMGSMGLAFVQVATELIPGHLHKWNFASLVYGEINAEMLALCFTAHRCLCQWDSTASPEKFSASFKSRPWTLAEPSTLSINWKSFPSALGGDSEWTRMEWEGKERGLGRDREQERELLYCWPPCGSNIPRTILAFSLWGFSLTMGVVWVPGLKEYL